MGIVTSSSFAKALWPGVNKWYGDAYNEYPVEYTKLFDTFKSSRAEEQDVGVSGLGLAAVKNETDGVSYDSERQGFTKRYNHLTYALGFMVTKEAFDDDLYDVIGKRRARGLAFSMRQTKEIVAANVYNRAFNSSYTGADGSAMCVNNHANVAGGTWSNILGTAADLSEAALEQACIDISALTNDRGLKVALVPDQLIIHPNDEFNAFRILTANGRVGNNYNDPNALKELGKFRKGSVINHYLTDGDAWFIRTNAPDGMKYWERRADDFTMDNDFDTENAKFKAVGRYCFGWTDPRGIFGTPGA